MSHYEADLDLPSKGVFYEDGLSKIIYRNVTTDEEMILYGSSSDSTINRVLNRCIIEPKGLDVGNLVAADKLAYLINLRIHTYGSDYKQSSFCPKCEREGTFDASLDDLIYEELGEIKLPLRLPLPISKDVVELKILTDNKYNAIKDRVKKIASRTKGNEKQMLFKAKLAAQIKAVNDKELNLTEAEEYVNGMHSRDSQTIESALKSIKMGYIGEIEIKCPECGNVFKSPFLLNSEFFHPSLKISWC